MLSRLYLAFLYFISLSLSLNCFAQAIGIGDNHPSSGTFSPVDEANWNSGTWRLGSNFTTNGDLEVALYSRHAERVLLEIYSSSTNSNAANDYWMQKGPDNIWRAKIANVPDKTLYAFRAWGPNWPFDSAWDRGNSSAGFINDVDSLGNRYNPNKVLFDPYSRELSHDKDSRELKAAGHNGGIFGTGSGLYKSVIRRSVDTGQWAPKSVALKDDGISFGVKPAIPQQDAIIYEASLFGLTKDPSSAKLASILASHPNFSTVENVPAQYHGTYKGAGYMAKYLKGLGFTAIELLPIHEWNNQQNFGWGYNNYSFFAVDRQYAHDQSLGGPTAEFKEMVKAFHDEGIEVYLDVVYNHTAEGCLWDNDTKTREIMSYAGLDNRDYYALSGGKWCWVTTGVSNNLNGSTDVVKDMIIDSLTYWSEKMGVDGFRFDLAAVLGRDAEPGFNFNANAQLLQDIASLGNRFNVEMFAEAWDLQTYQVGNFPTGWGEWNDKFRDVTRQFIRGAGNWPSGSSQSFTDGFYGSHKLYNDQGGPEKSVNFITAHDGYTMMDLVSYNQTNNVQAFPWGPSDGGHEPNFEWDSNGSHSLRRKQLRNIWTILMFARGVPMVTMGDEMARSQNGNNNAYNLDSVAVWNNYNMISTSSPTTVIPGQHNNYGTDTNDDGWNNIFNFASFVTNLRKHHDALRQGDYRVGYSFDKLDGSGPIGNNDKCIRVSIDGSAVGDSDFLLFINTLAEQKEFTIPHPGTGNKWVRRIDTAKWAEGNDNQWSLAAGWSVASRQNYGVEQHSIVVFEKAPI